MKICDITQYYAPQSGGVKRYLETKRQRIRQSNGLEHVLIVPARFDSVDRDGSTVVYTVKSPPLPFSHGYRFFVAFPRIREILREEKPDIIESADLSQCAWCALDVGRKTGTPVAHFYHSDLLRSLGSKASEVLRRPVPSAILWYTRRMLRAMDVVFVANVEKAELLKRLGAERVVHMPLGVCSHTFNPANASGENVRAELGIDRATRLLLFVGRVAGEKRLHLLFDMLDVLQARSAARAKYRLLIIGDGPRMWRVRQRARDRDDVTLWNYVDNTPRLVAAYCESDVFVHPGKNETFGLAPLEARFCGCPAVAVADSGLPAVIGHEGGRLARKASALHLAAAVRRVLRRRMPRDRVREAAVAEFAEEAQFVRQIEVYESVINRNGVAHDNGR